MGRQILSKILGGDPRISDVFSVAKNILEWNIKVLVFQISQNKMKWILRDKFQIYFKLYYISVAFLIVSPIRLFNKPHCTWSMWYPLPFKNVGYYHPVIIFYACFLSDN